MWIVGDVPTTRLTVACIALTIAGSCLFWLASLLEHKRSVRPSTVLCVYLGISALLDLARVRTLFFMPGTAVVARVNLAGYCTKVLLLCLEVTEKRHLLRPDWQHASPEEASGVLNRSLFVWLNTVFIKGFRTVLTVNVLTPLDSQLLSASNPLKLIITWINSELLCSLQLDDLELTYRHRVPNKPGCSFLDISKPLQMELPSRRLAAACIYGLQFLTTIFG